jgi:hypothetical protein
MTQVLITFPWGEWTFKLDTVPRPGEHVEINTQTFVVTAICHYPDRNVVRIGVERT